MRTILALMTLSLPLIAHAYDFPNVIYIRAYDGDTITVTIPDTHPLFGESISIRVAGIDTPEIRGKCQKEKDLAYEARDFVRQRLLQSQRIDLRDAERGKYFRIVARVVADGQDLSDLLIQNALAVPYGGGAKVKDWCA